MLIKGYQELRDLLHIHDLILELYILKLVDTSCFPFAGQTGPGLPRAMKKTTNLSIIFTKLFITFEPF